MSDVITQRDTMHKRYTDEDAKEAVGIDHPTTKIEGAAEQYQESDSSVECGTEFAFGFAMGVLLASSGGNSGDTETTK